MSLVSEKIKQDLEAKSGIQSEIIHLTNFYHPIRGNLRRMTQERKNSIVLREEADDEAKDKNKRDIL